ncbi:MAG: hypothetical protein K2Y22_02980 [Candidatus Obscuribacterales bacterium]|nr:hypothetical protein [Candidatus Obscuribacterales bacterium]
MDSYKLSDKQARELAREEANLFSDYVSVRANTSASTVQGAQILTDKVKIDNKLFGANSNHVRTDYKAMDRDFTESGVSNRQSASRDKYTESMKKQAAIAHERAKETTTLAQDKVLSIKPEHLKTYVSLFDEYAQARANKDSGKCAKILTDKLELDERVFGKESINALKDFEAIGRDNEEAGNHKQAGTAYFMARLGYRRKNDDIFATLAGLHAARNYAKANVNELAIPLFASGLSFYDKLEQKLDKPGSVKQSSPYIRAELGHCYLKEGDLDLAEKELTKSLDDSRIGFDEIIPQGSIKTLRDLVTVKTLKNKLDEAAKYAKLLQETEKRYQH